MMWIINHDHDDDDDDEAVPTVLRHVNNAILSAMVHSGFRYHVKRHRKCILKPKMYIFTQEKKRCFIV